MPRLNRSIALLGLVLITGPGLISAMAQAPLPVPQQPSAPQGAPLPAQGPPPAAYPPGELDRIVSPIALYPDPLLAQVLAAASFSDQVPDAARWADEHHYLTGASLTSAMAADQIPWDPSVQALIPFPSVLDMMASDMPWTQEIGTAFLTQRNEVMDAVQRERQKAASFGYLRSNPQVVVKTGPYIEIVPANPDYIVVPYYDPLVVYAPPRRGIVVGAAIRFGFGVTLGAVFAPWGWHANHFGWAQHTVIINNAPWGRTWANRATYVHPYTVQRFRPAPGPHPVDHHELKQRSVKEREEERRGRNPHEEHRPRG